MKTIKIVGGLIGGVLVLLALCYFTQKAHMDATRLPANTTLTAFLEERPNPIAIYTFTVEGKEYVFVQARFAPGDFGLSSGPPAYIFDDRGALADWTDDNNEGRPFAPRWHSGHSKGGVPAGATPITVEEAKVWINQSKTANEKVQQTMSAPRDLRTIASNLTKAGLFTDLKDTNALNVVKSGANRGLWILHVNQNWYVITYIQQAYQIPSEDVIERFCIECLQNEKFENVDIPDDVVTRFSLRLLSVEEHKKISPPPGSRGT